MKSRILQLVSVTVISVLVWILAEGLTLRPDRVNAEVRFDPGSSTRVVRISPGDTFDGQVDLSIVGSRNGIDELARQLREPITLELGSEIAFEPGEQLIDLLTSLRSSPMFKRSGVTIQNATPRFVRIQADELATVEVPVQVELPDIQVDGVPRAEPDVITYTVPRSVLRNLEVEKLSSSARLTMTLLNNLPRGTEQKIEGVRVIPDEKLAKSWYLQPANAQTTVILTVRSRTSTLAVPSVPVQILISPTELERFRIEVPESSRFIHDVSLRGPGPLIDQIRSDPSLRPVAVVPLTFEDLENGITKARARLMLPRGFEAVDAEADALMVDLNITRIESPSEPE